MSELGFLFIGYAVVWVALGAYFIAVGRRQMTLRRELERLEQELRAQD
jgi:CcmD family protein